MTWLYTYSSAPWANRIIWFSVNEGFTGIVLLPCVLAIVVDDILLPIVLKFAKLCVEPVTDDGLYVCDGLNGLRDCCAGSGLKLACVES